VFTYIALRVLHIAFAATWFGLPIGSTGATKRALGRDVAAVRAALLEANRRENASLVFGVLTLVTGVVLVFDLGGFGAIPASYHLALTLILVMLALSLVLLRPTGAKLQALANDPSFRLPDETARSLVKRLTIGSGVMQLLWLVILVLMYYRF
jgi:hypothetical protein